MKEDYESAYLETLNFRLGPVFWEPLFQAVSLSQLGKLTEAKSGIDALLQLKPDFSTRGRTLMKRTLKSERIMGMLARGLENAGLVLAQHCHWSTS